MLDRRFVADNIELIIKNCCLRGASVDVAKFAELDILRRQLQLDIDRLNQEAGQVSKSIGKVPPDEREPLKAEGRRLREKVSALQSRQAEVLEESDKILRSIPNLTHSDAPHGGEADATEVRRGVSSVPSFSFTPKDHVELGENLKLFDFEAGSRVAGHGFYFLTNDGVLLELALQKYAIDLLMQEGFTVMTLSLIHI